jgi:phospholipid/cholesterol/gamma-HCH transport system substrate-binding protein
MRRTRADLIRVGILVVVAGSVLVGGLLWVAGARLFREVATYSVLFDESVSGLNAGANVEYQGVVVGRVRDVRLTAEVPPKVAVIVDLEPATPVRTDTVAYLLGSLVTGIKFIELQGGTAAAPPLPPGGTIPGEAPSLEQFRDRLTEIADRVVSILRSLEENVFTEANATKLGVLLDDLGTVARTLNRTVETFRAKQTSRDLARLIEELSSAAHNANVILGDLSGRRGEIVEGLSGSVRNLEATTRAARALLEKADTQLVGAGRSLTELLAELTAATERLQETLDVIRTNPSLLLWGGSAPEREFAR